MAFQLQVGMTTLDIYEASSKKAIKLIEGSLFSSRSVVSGFPVTSFSHHCICRFCFLENMRRTGLVEPLTFHVLEGWYDRVLTNWRSKPVAIGIVEYFTPWLSQLHIPYFFISVLADHSKRSVQPTKAACTRWRALSRSKLSDAVTRITWGVAGS